MKLFPHLAFKSILSKIHHPPTLNPRESRKLLNLLRDSFRRQMEKHHPESSATESNPMDTHFRSLLEGPLSTRPRAFARPAEHTLTSHSNGDTLDSNPETKLETKPEKPPEDSPAKQSEAGKTAVQQRSNTPKIEDPSAAQIANHKPPD